ncbi:H/ACA ribonucleoprotein complex non-core subunit NAF1 isoform X2 [Python bivittatus]|uniref:H/ACA ribonucleoprotein complex non-core subunit NAF1 n=1 Tax=Python bivittatus TaxID=176946 RepID=A0A9F5MRC9_PYTBI|nr:H/ACA ribonucleoprotein complex non-core subunit NAF1 isoform X2 [Python bivittatus]
MDVPSASLVDGDSGLSGSIVAEQLQTLRVACEGSPSAAPACPQGAALKDDDRVPLSPERLCGEAPANRSELPQEQPGPPWVALKGGGVEGDAPQPGPAAEEKPASPGDGNGQTSPETGGEQTCSPDEHLQAAEALSEREKEHRPPEEVKAGHQPSPSALLGSNSELKNGGLNRQTAPVRPEEQDGLSKGNPAAPGSERGSLAVESCGGLNSSSEPESDTDADSSSSLSSCSPMLSEDDDKQDKNENNSYATRKKSELSKEPLPVEDIMIILPESVELMPFGKVSSFIEHLVIIESQKGLPPVNEDTVLFKEDRHSVGKIFEIFGPVSHPFYVLQFNSPEHIQSKGIKIKDEVYFAPSVESFTQYIFPEKLKQEKGSDASWKNDEEPPAEALDFSDDEKERAAKLQKKSQNVRRKELRSQQNNSNDNGGNYQSRRQYPSEYAGGYCRGQPTPRFSWGRSPHVSPFPRFYRQHNVTPQYYSSDYAELQKPTTFCQQQRLESMRRHQYSFPPPSFETVGSNTNFPPPPPSIPWGWPPGCTQNTYEPLLSMLSLPPPPPPPLPPPSTAPNTGSSP